MSFDSSPASVYDYGLVVMALIMDITMSVGNSTLFQYGSSNDFSWMIWPLVIIHQCWLLFGIYYHYGFGIGEFLDISTTKDYLCFLSYLSSCWHPLNYGDSVGLCGILLCAFWAYEDPIRLQFVLQFTYDLYISFIIFSQHSSIFTSLCLIL